MKLPARYNLKTKMLLAMLCISLLPLIFLANISIRGLLTVGTITREESLNKLKYDTIELQMQNLNSNSKYINLELQRIYDQVSAVRLVAEGLYSKKLAINNSSVNTELTKDERGFYWTPIDNQDKSTVFISSGVKIDTTILEDVKTTTLLEPIFMNITHNNSNVDAIYFITRDNLTRIYPQLNFPDLIYRGKLSSDMNCYDYPFFYTADPINNPEKKIKWTETYYDVTDKGWMVTCLAPIYLPDNTFKGVIGIDITIDKLKQNIIDKNLENSELYTILLNEKGNNVIFTSKAQMDFLGSLDLNNQNLLRNANKKYTKLFSKMIQGNTGYEIININGNDKAIIYAPISATNWSLGLVVPIKEITGDIESKINNQIKMMNKSILSKMIWSGALIALVIIFLSFYLSRKITDPILNVVDSCLAISKGDLEKRVKVKSQDEIGILAREFNSMAEKLNDTINNLNELNKNLETIIRKRTIALQKSNENLKKINNKLRQAEAARRIFFANISHDLRTPLTAIQGYVEILREGFYADQDQYKNYLTIIFKWSIRLNHMINNLLELSTIQSGLNLKLTLVDDKFFEKWIEIVSHEVRNKNIEFSGIIRNTFSNLYIDENMLERALFNIIQNSIKFTSHGGKITVEIYPVENVHILISIEDTGSGISPDDLPYIYDRFYQGKSENSTGKKGIGLGLAIAKEIIEAHNGKIDISSHFGQGTIITITLPLNLKKN